MPRPLPDKPRILRALKALQVGDKVLDRHGAIGWIDHIEYATGYVQVSYQHREPQWRPIERVRKVPRGPD